MLMSQDVNCKCFSDHADHSLWMFALHTNKKPAYTPRDKKDQRALKMEHGEMNQAISPLVGYISSE